MEYKQLKDSMPPFLNIQITWGISNYPQEEFVNYFVTLILLLECTIKYE